MELSCLFSTVVVEIALVDFPYLELVSENAKSLYDSNFEKVAKKYFKARNCCQKKIAGILNVVREIS